MFIWQTPPAWLMPSMSTSDHGDVVDHWRGPAASRRPTGRFAVLLPFALVGQHRRFHLTHGSDDPLEALGQRLPGELLNQWLGIEQIEVAGPPSMNRKMTLLAGRRNVDSLVRAASGSAAGGRFVREQTGQGDRPETAAAATACRGGGRLKCGGGFMVSSIDVEELVGIQ